MTERNRITVIAASLLVVCMALSVVTLRSIDRVREDATLQEVLYIPSATTVKRMSLGYDGLMATIYWTRVVQYFGGKHHEHAQEYKLLKPLLDITTTLDPHLLVAYEFGSTFLAQTPPEGAGDPEAAAQLVEKGIQQNPGAWRLYYHLGYIYWLELHDSKRASEAFEKGSEVPGALPWMKVMAAYLAQNAGEAQAARYLWTNIYESSEDPSIRANARKRLIALRVDEEVEFLQQLLDRYKEQQGKYPASFGEMLQAGYIRRVPLDPLGLPYQIRDGHIEVSRPDELPFISRGLPGQKASTTQPTPSNSR